MISLEVKCYSGYRGEETPRAIVLHGKKIRVKRLIDSWLAPDHRYFKFTGSDQGTYIIRHDPRNNIWELTFYKETPLFHDPWQRLTLNPAGFHHDIYFMNIISFMVIHFQP